MSDAARVRVWILKFNERQALGTLIVQGQYVIHEDAK